MLHAVIMAGGTGTRFWPESRAARPKQLLNLWGQGSLLQQASERISGLVPLERQMVVTNCSLVSAVAAQLPQLRKEAIVGEPCKRDTAPCIGLAALCLQKTDPDAVLLVMPSDHVIRDTQAFRQAVEVAERLIAQSPGRIVTFGIQPTYPSETFGYIERAEPISPPDATPAVYRVARFREKPKADLAREFLATGRFYWNSGIFVWRAETIVRALAQRQPEMVEHLQAIAAAFGNAQQFQRALDTHFPQIKGISIDYAVMEHASDVAVIEAPYDWDDVGSWQALARLHGTDPAGNTVVGKHLGIQTTNSILRGPEDHLLVTLGVDNLIVVHMPDATLVADKRNEEAMRQLVKLLEERGWHDLL